MGTGVSVVYAGSTVPPYVTNRAFLGRVTSDDRFDRFGRCIRLRCNSTDVVVMLQHEGDVV